MVRPQALVVQAKELSAMEADPFDRRRALERALAVLAPRLPDFEAGVVVDRALASPGLRRAAADNAVWLALVSYARHAFTDYDALLDDGYDRDSARHFVLDDLNDALSAWGVRREVSDAPDADEHDAPGA